MSDSSTLTEAERKRLFDQLHKLVWGLENTIYQLDYIIEHNAECDMQVLRSNLLGLVQGHPDDFLADMYRLLEGTVTPPSTPRSPVPHPVVR